MGANTAGPLLREWRQRRRFSQLELAHAAEVSAKHLSYVETGRSRPSPEMILHLCSHLDVPLRDRNTLLLAAGHAPRYRETPYDNDARSELSELVDLVLDGHRYPAVAVDANWNLVAANNAAAIFLTDIAAHLLSPPINVIRLSLHPEGLAGRIENLSEYATHTLDRLQRQTTHQPSDVIDALLEEFEYLTDRSQGTDKNSNRHARDTCSGLSIPIELGVEANTTLRLVSTITTFGAPRDIALAELAVEAFYPADPATRTWLDRYAGTHTGRP